MRLYSLLLVSQAQQCGYAYPVRAQNLQSDAQESITARAVYNVARGVLSTVVRDAQHAKLDTLLPGEVGLQNSLHCSQ